MEKTLLTLSAILLFTVPGYAQTPQRWSAEQARQWYRQQPWLVGCNYVPSTAVNDVEMWQKETYDPKTIDRELQWARSLGFNSLRVFVNYVVWKDNPAGFKQRFEQFLSLAAAHHLSVIPVLFDDCAFAGREPRLGRQNDPVPGVHNSGWVPSPGRSRVTDPKTWPDLQQYVQDMAAAYGHDKRIVFWDLYNEPGNSLLGDRSLPLLEAAFTWARATRPSQPLTAGLWKPSLQFSRRQAELSDITTFHFYGPLDGLQRTIATYQALGRPAVCTEWMARGLGSRWETDLPLFKQEHIGCYCWGLVAGRTQTYFPWRSPQGAPAPKTWFHDLLHPDGTPYDPREIDVIRAVTAAPRDAATPH